MRDCGEGGQTYGRSTRHESEVRLRCHGLLDGGQGCLSVPVFFCFLFMFWTASFLAPPPPTPPAPVRPRSRFLCVKHAQQNLERPGSRTRPTLRSNLTWLSCKKKTKKNKNVTCSFVNLRRPHETHPETLEGVSRGFCAQIKRV